MAEEETAAVIRGYRVFQIRPWRDKLGQPESLRLQGSFLGVWHTPTFRAACNAFNPSSIRYTNLCPQRRVKTRSRHFQKAREHLLSGYEHGIGHGCGLYLTTLEKLQDEYGGIDRYRFSRKAIAACSAWGAVVIYTDGIRAERVRIEHLWTFAEPSACEKLEEWYKIPVSPISDLFPPPEEPEERRIWDRY